MPATCLDGLTEPFALLDAGDARMVDALNLMEELGTCVNNVQKQENGRKRKGLSSDNARFWTTYVILPKASHTANIYLLQDDVPGILAYACALHGATRARRGDSSCV